MPGSWTPGRRPNLDAAIGRALDEIGYQVLSASDRDVPVASGALRRSGRYEVDGDTVGIGYSDPKAVAAHENQSVSYRRGKSAKFLERALNSVAPRMGRIAQDELRKEFQ